MTRRETFLIFVGTLAVARDVSRRTQKSESLLAAAARIPETFIPPQPFAAAQVYVERVSENRRPCRWMVGAGKGFC